MNVGLPVNDTRLEVLVNFEEKSEAPVSLILIRIPVALVRACFGIPYQVRSIIYFVSSLYDILIQQVRTNMHSSFTKSTHSR